MNKDNKKLTELYNVIQEAFEPGTSPESNVSGPAKQFVTTLNDQHLIWEAYTRSKNQPNPSLILLVGPPAIGKSTWIRSNMKDAVVLSRDDIVDRVASQHGLSYDDTFKTPSQTLPIGSQDPKFGTVIERPDGFPSFLPDKLWDVVVDVSQEITSELKRETEAAKKSGKDVVVDMTNMNPAARSSWLSQFPEHKKIAVVFNFQGDDTKSAIRNLASKRAKEIADRGGSKTIPDSAFDNMYRSYQEPTSQEGFDEIIHVDDRERIMKHFQHA